MLFCCWVLLQSVIHGCNQAFAVILLNHQKIQSEGKVNYQNINIMCSPASISVLVVQ